MISSEVITRQWLSRVSNEKGWPDIHLLEKITRAALLIEGLSWAGMQCILHYRKKSLDFLKPLRKTNPEAYFYWYNTWKLLREKMFFLSVGGVNDI